MNRLPINYKPPTLLGRDEFRNAVLARDKGLCINCGAKGQDAHHILERRLFTEPKELGGYFLDNGATLCAKCHVDAESTSLSATKLREILAVKAIYPDDFYDDGEYDKWGNEILVSGKRLMGPLMRDESVLKILAIGGFWPTEFENVVKYPRTYHLPWSEGLRNDDRTMQSLSALQACPDVVVMEKLDGENTTFMRDRIYARSLDGRNHPSRDWVKNLWGTLAYEIPENWRFSGENMFAKHSIKYEGLKSYYYLFGIWDNENNLISWDDTVAFADILKLETPAILYRGPWDEEKIRSLYGPSLYHISEGYVVRNAGAFNYKDFKHNVGKFVRRGHVATSEHWMFNRIEKNELIS